MTVIKFISIGVTKHICVDYAPLKGAAHINSRGDLGSVLVILSLQCNEYPIIAILWKQSHLRLFYGLYNSNDCKMSGIRIISSALMWSL